MGFLGFYLEGKKMMKFKVVANDDSSVEIYVIHQKRLISTLDGETSFNARSEICLASGEKVIRLDQGKYEVDGKIFFSDDPTAP